MLTFQPKSLLVTAIFFATFGTMLAVADDAGSGIAAAGLLAVLAYVAIEVFLTFNPAAWWRERRGDHR